MITPIASTNNLSSPSLPNEPNYYPIPSSDEQLKLYSLGPKIRKASCVSLFQAVKRDVAYNVKNGNAMSNHPLHYDMGHVHLIFHVTVAMSWHDLGTMVRGLQGWMEKWEFVQCDFDMGQLGVDRMFGTGALVAFDEPKIALE
ncbi:hypothetical protein ACLMJK_008553 [Lecanora helva]